MKIKKDFELVPHTADLKIHVYGDSLAELYRHALMGMFQIVEPVVVGCKKMAGRIHCSVLPIRHEIKIFSLDKDSLLVDFLSQALYLSAINKEAYFDADVLTLTDSSIQVIVQGVKVIGFAVELKAVTYHDLKIVYKNDEWQTDVVFDI